MRTPNARPHGSVPCDPRLPEAALQYRRTANPPLTSRNALGAINVTAWLYRDTDGKEGVQVNPNVTIADLQRIFGPAPTPDAEIGFHSEGRAAEWFRMHPKLQVLQIFTERVPCAQTCAPLLRHYYPNVPWYYYYDSSSWRGDRGELLKRAGDILKTVYGL